MSRAVQDRLTARYETAMHLLETGGDLSRLTELLTEAVTALGERDPVTYMIACGLEEHRSAHRPVLDSARVWTLLRTRAERTLAGDDPSLMSIRSFHVRYTRRGGGTAELDAGVAQYKAEWELRAQVLPAGHYRIGVARANYALALRDRGRDPDLAEALAILREESTHRREAFGGDHPFTWTAQVILAQTLVRLAERADPSRAEELAREALVLAAAVTQRRQWRFGWSDPATLQAHLVHAHGLLLLGEPALAAREIQDVQAAAARTRAKLEPGWPEFLLARAQAASQDPQALSSARLALAARSQHLPPDNPAVQEAQHLVDTLTACEQP